VNGIQFSATAGLSSSNSAQQQCEGVLMMGYCMIPFCFFYILLVSPSVVTTSDCVTGGLMTVSFWWRISGEMGYKLIVMARYKCQARLY